VIPQTADAAADDAVVPGSSFAVRADTHFPTDSASRTAAVAVAFAADIRAADVRERVHTLSASPSPAVAVEAAAVTAFAFAFGTDSVNGSPSAAVTAHSATPH